ncbi:ornithine cyclodeaminase, partial [Rhizobium ruizarguesonis]
MFDTTTDSNVRFLTRQDLQSAGSELTLAEIHAATDASWADIKSGKAFGGKAVLSLPEEALVDEVTPERGDALPLP